MSSIVRACFRAVKVEGTQPPYDTIHLKVFYPAQQSANEQERYQGVFPVNPQQAPFPVVIFFGGVNCGPESYQWLAVNLAQQGMVVITFAWVSENIPGTITLTPGINTTLWQPNTYGTGPTASALGALLNELEALQTNSLLTGLLDLNRVILGGHSAGGRVALESANPRFYPQLVAAFGYGVHTAGPIAAGHPANTILPLPSALPTLIMGGTCDGVIAARSGNYGMEPGNPTKVVARTFHEAIAGGRNDSYLVLWEGANHFAIAHPQDPTTATGFLDQPATQPPEQTRALIAKTIWLFIDAHVRQQAEAAQSLEQFLSHPHPLMATFERK